MRRLAAPVALLLGIILLSAPTAADERVDEASAWFKRGAEAFKRGDAAEAAEAFEEANRLVPHGATVYNAALAWEAAGKLARAAQSFAEALDRGGLTDEQAVDARKRLDSLSSRVGKLYVTAPPGAKISVAYFKNALPPIEVFLAPGDHTVEVVFESGEKVTRTVTMGAVREDLDIQAPEHEQGAPVVVDEGTVSEGGNSHTLGWVAVGGAVVLSGAAVYLGLEALEARDTFNDSGHTDADAHDRAASLRTWTNVVWVAAGASAVTGVVLLMGDSGDEEKASGAGRMELRIGPGSATFAGTF